MHTSLGYVDDDVLQGMIVVRKCLQGYKVGPLFADNIDIANHLL